MQRAGVQRNLHWKQVSRIGIFCSCLSGRSLIHSSSAFTEVEESSDHSVTGEWLTAAGWNQTRELGYLQRAQLKGFSTEQRLHDPKSSSETCRTAGSSSRSSTSSLQDSSSSLWEHQKWALPMQELGRSETASAVSSGHWVSSPKLSPHLFFLLLTSRIRTCCWAYRNVKKLIFTCCSIHWQIEDRNKKRCLK